MSRSSLGVHLPDPPGTPSAWRGRLQELERWEWREGDPADPVAGLAAYPPGVSRSSKYWPPVRRIDGAFGDRNLVCSCPSPEAYEQ